MFKIGEFARMGQVSVRTLHHYEDLGLLKPIGIDQFSGYRYYSTTQLPRLNRILAFKDLGLSLEQIGYLLDANLTADQLKEILILKQAELGQQLKETETLLRRVETWLSQLERGSEMISESNYEITLKKVKPLLVASLRQTMPAYGYLGGPFGVLRSYLAQFGFKHNHPSQVLWHFSNTDLEEQGFEVELLEELDELVPGNEQIKIYTLPELELAASVTHQGGLDLAYLAYQALGSWVETQGYKVAGPTRQIHHIFNPRQDPATYLTEFQLPIALLISPEV